MSSEFISNPEEAKEFLPRYRLLYSAIGIVFVLFVARLWYLQVIEGEQLREFSEKNHLKQNKIMAPRGMMLDRDGQILVENHPGFEATLMPQYIKDLDGVVRAVAPIIGQDPEKLVTRVNRLRRQNGPYAPIKVKDNLSREEVFRLKRARLDIPGLDIREKVIRYYPLSANGAQLFGYVAEISKRQIPIYNKMYQDIFRFAQGDLIGKTGLEEVFEKEIRGQDGIQYVQVDAFGRETTAESPNIYGESITDLDSVPGNNLILTIDRQVQEAAWKSFETNQRIGGLVAMKSNGEVLAWVSAPSFDPNDFSMGVSAQTWNQLVNDPFKPLRNKVIQDHFSPGSTFKPFIALASLEEGLISPNTIIHCPGAFWFGGRFYHDHLKGGHGNISVYEAIERSSNVFFYKMGIGLGIEKMHPYISQLGIGSKTGIELPRETSGLMPSAAWKKKNVGEDWQAGENLSVAIGQGFVNANVLQMAVAYNTIALEGKVVKPYLMKRIVDLEGKTMTQNSDVVIRDVQKTGPGIQPISEATFKVVKEAMRRVVQGDRGTARSLRIPGVEIAGKTGTSQVMQFSADQIYAKCEGRPIHQRHHGWFVGWAPADNPEITVAALAEHSCHGGSGAGPMVRDTIRAYFEKYHPERIANAMKLGKGNKQGQPGAVEAVEGE